MPRTLKRPRSFATGSDCEVIVHLYEERGADFVADLDGVFAFVLADETTGEIVAARDPIGVVPLYWGHGSDGSLWFASELKAIHDVCPRFEQFPPGHVFADGVLWRYYDPSWRRPDAEPTARPSAEDLRSAVEEAVVSEPSIACSSAPALEWEADWAAVADPSGRAVGSHRDAYGK